MTTQILPMEHPLTNRQTIRMTEPAWTTRMILAMPLMEVRIQAPPILPEPQMTAAPHNSIV